MKKLSIDCPICSNEFTVTLLGSSETIEHRIKCAKCEEDFVVVVEDGELLIKPPPGKKTDKLSRPLTDEEEREYYEPMVKDLLKERKPPPSKGGEKFLKYASILMILVLIFGTVFAVLCYKSPDIMGYSDERIDVTGTVRYENGTPAQNATVSILGENPTIKRENFSTKTDENGSYKLKNVLVGKQKITVSKEGYKNYTKRTILIPSSFGSDNTGKVDFKLKKGEGEILEDDETLEAINVCVTGMVLFLIIALLGTITLIRRNNYILALTGAFAGIFTVGFIIGIFFSGLALLFIIKGRRGFRR